MLMFGNLLRECGVTERLSHTAANELINIVTIFLALIVGSRQIELKDIHYLWGTDLQVAGKALRRMFPGAGHRTILRIGPAGERQSPMACITADTYRHFGRLGGGAVMGSKRLKAIVVKGNKGMELHGKNFYSFSLDEKKEVRTRDLKKIAAFLETGAVTDPKVKDASFNIGLSFTSWRTNINFIGAIMVTNTWSSFTYVPFFPFLLGCVWLAHARGIGRLILDCVPRVLAPSLAVEGGHSEVRDILLGYGAKQ
jgi:hypothetical protein